MLGMNGDRFRIDAFRMYYAAVVAGGEKNLAAAADKAAEMLDHESRILESQTDKLVKAAALGTIEVLQKTLRADAMAKRFMSDGCVRVTARGFSAKAEPLHGEREGYEDCDNVFRITYDAPLDVNITELPIPYVFRKGQTEESTPSRMVTVEGY